MLGICAFFYRQSGLRRGCDLRQGRHYSSKREGMGEEKMGGGSKDGLGRVARFI